MPQVSDRYQLTGDILDGELDLDILNVRRTDSGPYCCRVDIDGVFNDKKVIMNLRVVKGEQLKDSGQASHHLQGQQIRTSIPHFNITVAMENINL